MYYQDRLLSAASALIDLDVPVELLPLTISSQAALFAGFDSDLVGDPDRR